MAKFVKGMARPEGAGRKKGSNNYNATNLRQALGNYIAKQLEPKILDDMLNDLEPKERIDTLIRLMPYCMPKVQATTVVEDEQEPRTIEVVLVKPPMFDSNGKRLFDCPNCGSDQLTQKAITN